MPLRTSIAVLAVALVVSACGDNRRGGPDALVVEPRALELPNGTAAALVARYDTDDGAVAAGEEVEWTSSDDAIATVEADGAGGVQVVARAEGPVWISARSGYLESTSAVFVTPGIAVGLLLEPGHLDLTAGACGNVVAHARMSDGRTAPVPATSLQWTHGPFTTTAIDGTICGTTQGDDLVIARYRDVEASATVAVGQALPVELFAFVDSALTLGQTAQAVAWLTRADSTSEDVTGLVAWSADDPSIVTVDATGLVTAVGLGTGSIRARLADLEGQAITAVQLPPVQRVEVAPVNPTLADGATQQLTATAVFQGGLRLDVTGEALWVAGSPTIATVSPLGLVTAVAPGQGVVTARYSFRTGGTLVTVTP